MIHEFEPTGVERVQIDNVAGRITVRPMERHRLIVSVRKKKFSDDCKLTIEKESPSNVLVRVDGPSYDECEADLDVQVPAAIDLTVNAGSGPVEVNGVEGRLNFRVGNGSLTAKGGFKHVEGRSSTGPVTVEGLSGGGRIESGSGAVQLKFSADPQGQFTLNSGTGSTTVWLPKDVRVRTELSSGTGQVVNETKPGSKSDFSLNVTNGTGDIQVKSY